MISPSENTDGTNKSNSHRYASFPNMLDNHVGFQPGKEKNELSAHEEDDRVVSDGDKARIRDNLTPKRRKKTKSIKMCPREFLQPNSNIQIYSTATGIWESEIQLHKFHADNEKCVRKEKIEVGGSLDMLVDAIQLVEDRRPKRNPGLKVQENGLVSVLPESIKEGKNSMGSFSLQNNQSWENDGMEAEEELGVDRYESDGQCNPKTADIDGEAVPRTRSKGGWLPTLPPKYSDSVLQPWKKVARKMPKH